MTLEEQIVVFEHNAEHERKEGDLNNCLHFRQLAEWLKDYKRLLEQEPCEDVCEWFVQSIDIVTDIVEFRFSDGTVKRAKRGLYMRDIEESLRKMLIDQMANEKKQEPCEDSISRQATLDAIIKRLGIKNETYLLEAERVIYQQILAMPSVTPQPKMGRWIMSDDGLYRPICNNCGGHPWKGYIPTVEEATEVFKYCPNCGYAMQEVEE